MKVFKEPDGKIFDFKPVREKIRRKMHEMR